MKRTITIALGLAMGALSAMVPTTAIGSADEGAVIEGLKRRIAHEMNDKQLPAVMIALVDDRRVIWAEGFGYARPDQKIPATKDTVCRVGSVSKLFAALAVMQLVDDGKIDLDAPIEKCLPNFHPTNPFDKPITIRQLLAHRSGIVREPPVGSYFDDTGTSLAAMVESLNGTTLVYPPGAKTKYSNAAVSVAGFAVETLQGKPFADVVRERILSPLGMGHSGFERNPAIDANLADAYMWTVDGRSFPAPSFRLATIPAGNLYSSAADLATFAQALLQGGVGARGRVLSEASLRQMWEHGFPMVDEPRSFGVGFALGSLDDHRMVRHGGAVYGFATEFAILPDEKLGAIAITNVDCANPVVEKLAHDGLRGLLAVRAGKEPTLDAPPRPIEPAVVRKWVGRYRSDRGQTLELIERDGQLVAWWGRTWTPARALADGWILDGRLSRGARFTPVGDDKLRIGEDDFARQPDEPPPDPPAHWLGVIGEYGWDHNTLFILEKDGELHALIEWFFLYPLKEVEKDQWAFPQDGLYHDERIVFVRNEAGQATKALVAGVEFPRRPVGTKSGTFRIQPVRPIEELRTLAESARPPAQPAGLAKPELVDLQKRDDSLRFDIRYATTDNFLSSPMYQEAKAFLQRPAADALTRVQAALAPRGFGLLIHDAYRPWSVTKLFWEATPRDMRHFVADPEQGSRHNRGCAVDLTLCDRKTGKALEMPGGYDEFSARSYPGYPGGTAAQRWRRDFLRRAMETEGFSVYEFEWWHFDYRDWRQYPVLNRSFHELTND